MRLEDDPTIGRIREARHRISARFGHDAHRLVEYYRQLEEREGRRPPLEKKPAPEGKGA
ncbi:MAG: hypothetical protein HY321_13485 [Armatimonadetes bacterium]|nr:hypothetical protein [Armatimonadota bacterium]